MNPLISLATFAVLALVGINSCGCVDLRARNYLQSSSIYTQQEIEWVATQVRAHGGQTAIKSVEYVRDLAERAAKAAKKEISIESAGMVGYSEKDIYQIWMALDAFQDLSTDCGSFQVKLFTQTVDVLYGDIDSFVLLVVNSALPDDKMLAYLAHVGVEHTKNCLESSMDRFEELKPRLTTKCAHAEQVFDDLFACGLKSVPDEKLAINAARYDLVNEHFNAKLMMKAVEKHLPEYDFRGHSSPAMKLFNFLRHTCGQIKRLEQVFDDYNLARALVPNRAATVNVSANFQKLNEYWRLCQQLSQEATSQIVRSNMEASMGKEKWYKRTA